MLWTTRCLVVVAIVCSVLAFERSARAQHTDDLAAAEALFKEAKKLIKAKSYAAACAKLETSQSLDPAIGTLMSLADCYQKQGKTATAWARWQESLDIARQKGDKKRIKVATKRVAKLEAKLSHLTVEVSDTGRLPGLVVTRDSMPIAPALLGTPLPTDPGTYTIKATAPGHDPWSDSVEVRRDGGTAEVKVPVLAETPVVAAPAPASQPIVPAVAQAMPASAPTSMPMAAAPAQPASLPVITAPAMPPPVTTAPPPPSPAQPAPAVAPAKARATAAAPPARPAATAAATAAPRRAKPLGRARGAFTSIALTLGVAGFGTGGYFALQALEKWADAKKTCDGQGGCDAAGAALAHDAQKAANFATVAAAAGAVAIFVGVIISATGPSAKAKPAKQAHIVPLVGGDSLGVVVEGGF